MIRARITNPTTGRSALIVGLSGENVKRLKENKPIYQPLEDLGLADTDLIVLYGDTEDDIIEDLRAIGAVE